MVQSACNSGLADNHDTNGHFVGAVDKMVQTLEAIRGGGGSIKVGTTGTISSLMTRELESIRTTPRAPISPRVRPQTSPVSIPCKASTPKRQQPRKTLDGASSSNSNNNLTDQRIRELARKTRGHTKNTHSQIPILTADDVSLDGTPARQKTERKGPNIAEVVDIRCRNQDRAWAIPITNRLKKLGFSKLSESIG